MPLQINIGGYRMKRKSFLIAILLVFISGSIVIFCNKHNKKFTIIPHIQTSPVYADESLLIFNEPGMNTEEAIDKLDYSSEVTIKEVAIQNINNRISDVWLHIQSEDNKVGWIYGGNTNPFFEGVGQTIEIFEINENTWTAIKTFPTDLIAADKLNVRNKPGLIDTKILFQIRIEDYGPKILERNWGPYYYGMYVTVLALTEEKDKINGVSEHWALIEDKFGRQGWVFGGFLQMGDIGGPKYYTARIMISMQLSPP